MAGADDEIWVARLMISGRTAHKLSTRHGLQASDVRDAVQCVEGLPFVWDDDPKRGRRAVGYLMIAKRPCYVVLYPVDDPLGDAYALGSAYPVD